MQRFNKILVANRGEIACRVLRTCKSMGIATVAVFSDADRDSLFVSQADEAIHIGPAPSSESYLVIDAIIEAARRSGADAIHPGYGFLAENADFAEACAKAGLVFIGPSPEAIRLLGSKKASKERVAAAGVPIVPSFAIDDPESFRYPVLLKASAGGGGKGMQVVHEAEALEEALASAKRVALSAFGDDTILVEQYVQDPRHIEIQILGDQHGNLLHLFERECSIQRRHQKIVEESPAPALDPQLRDAIARAAIEVGKAAGYTNAGTVEFILAPDGAFYFLEVNTRLQVEHPITEMVTGIDLVREQIRVAQGEALTLVQEDLRQVGAAIECRLYAEDCDNDFLPSGGRIESWFVPELDGLRVDTGAGSGSEISIHYDPMIAKLITHAPSRGEAIAKMRRTLQGLSAAGLTTNRVFLDQIMGHPAFAAAEIDTGFLARHAGALRTPAPEPALIHAAAMAATWVGFLDRRQARSLLPALSSGYRNSRWREERVVYEIGGERVGVGYTCNRDGSLQMRAPVPGIGIEATQDAEVASLRVECIAHEGTALLLDCGGHRRRFRVSKTGMRCFVLVGGVELELREVPRFPDRSAAQIEGGCIAPMPGSVVRVQVKNGDAVKTGDTLVVLEAMKMEHRIKADCDGIVSGLSVSEGEQVAGDQLLAIVQ